MSVRNRIETNPHGNSLCLFCSAWRKVFATSASVAGGYPGPVSKKRGTGRGPTPGHRCVRSDQTVRLETKEETQGIAFNVCQFQLVHSSACRLALSLLYARSAVFAGRRAIEAEAVAARAADIASLCCFAWAAILIEIGIGWHYTPLRENPSPKALFRHR